MAAESALVVLIPEAESLVGAFRDQFDPSASVGMPAHITVLYPFKSPHELTPGVIRSLEELFSKSPIFGVSFAESRRFPSVLYLSPSPDDAFRRLTEIVTECFPETPPYGGRFTDIVPHLTVAEVSDGQRLDEIAAEFDRLAGGHLPIRAAVSEIALVDNASGSWQVRTRFALGAMAS